MAMIKLENVNKYFDSFHAVRAVSLEVAKGATLVFLGSSGSGKTTGLKMINRLIDLSSGLIEVDGADIRDRDPIPLRRSMG